MKYAHELRPGDCYEPFSFVVSHEVNQQFLYSIGDYQLPYLPSSVDGAAFVHPMILLHMSARTRSVSFKLAPNTGSVFARDRVSFRRPALVGEQLTATWTISSVYERKDRLYQSLDIQVRGASDVVIDREMHSVFYTKDGVQLAAPTVSA